ncbi:MAG TPA: ElyC/SanA/YdcF family protein [Candidatus Saccharimonadales bacterium]|jgi:vancomycin permeability regulator SanA|nr:ElyC/SanA/YdcF family protein [Candidatus Saccharimonadales bacterium]
MKKFITRIVNLLKKHKVIVSSIILIGAIVLWGPTVFANLSTRSSRYDLNRTSISQIPKNKVAIVFGAGISQNGTPTPYLQWRVETAVRLYKTGRVQKLLMTGDNSAKNYDEPTAMKKLAEKEGVKSSDIVLDYAGFNTYDSCYRAHKIFGLNEATLISQGYHLPRAVMACDHLGVKSVGVDAVAYGRDWAINYTIREWIATDKIVLQLIFKPHPTALGPSVHID